MLLFAVSVQSQTTTIWLGGSTDWDDPTNWSEGIPESGFTVTIPGTPPNGNNFPVYSGGPLIDYTIQSFGGSITFNSVVYNTGSIINSGGGSVVNNSVFINAGMVTFNNNDGTFLNNGTVDNYGTLNNAGTSILENPVGSVFNNYGNIDNFGTINNGGDLLNNGDLVSTSTILNNGTITNNGFLNVAFGGTFTNEVGGNIVSTSGSFVEINTAFTNAGTITSDGSWFIQVGSTLFDNSGSFTSNGRLDLSGLLNNTGTMVTNDEMFINDSGKLENDNIFTNNGTITLSICGQIIQNANNNIAGTILNDGIIYVLNGSVTVTSNLDFGSEFTALNQRKAPDTKCRSGMFVFLDENGQGSITIDAVDKNSFGFCGAAIVDRTLSQSTFTVADLGVNELTLTTTDNFGESSSCNSFITVIDYFPPVVPVDDPDIDFACPADITVTPPAGGSSEVASWTEPTATTTCTGGTPGGGEPSCVSVPESIPGFNFSGEFADSKYYVSTDSSFNYNEALALAANFGGHLVTISDAAENQFVKDNLPVGSSAWLGYSDEASEGNYVWVTGEPTTYTNWNNGEPNDSLGTENFARIRQDNGNWTDRNGATYYYYVVLEIDCQQGSVSCSAVNENIANATYLGEFGESKFFVSNHAQTWNEAQTFAENNGGHLAVIDSQAENDFIQNNINPASGSVWIGLNNNNNGNNFSWVNNDPVVYTNWLNGEPNETSNHVAARLKNDDGLWTDRVLSNLFEVVFEIPCDNSAPTCEDVNLQITFDNYPEDISWVINDSNGSAVASGGSYGSEPDGSTVNLSNCLSTGCYDFVLTDSYGDGLCCNYGNGSWSIANADGTVYGSGAQFTTTQTASFCVITGGGNSGGGGENDLTVAQITGGQNGGQFPVGVNEVSYSVTDNCGNEEICTFTVTVEENPAEITVVDCPADIVVNTTPGAPTANVTWTAPTATTDCFKPNTTVEQTVGFDSGSDFLIGTQTIGYSITDSCGNFQACNFNVTVQAVQATLTLGTCPGDQALQVAAGQTSITATWNEPSGTSDCYTGSVQANRLVGPASGSVFPIGITQIVYVLTDECGNSALCAFNILVSESCPVVGTSCDDGDASTENDVEDGNCNCAGTPCPTVGTTCDDGDASTENDVEDGNCNCAGTPCPTVGTTCDDGDATTENDVEDGNCNCVGTPCPTVGTTCDDGNATTENDVEDGNCNCAGTPCPATGLACNDGNPATENDVTDGNCGCVGTPCPTVGTTCDDGDATTENDVEDGNCGCAGTPCPIAGTTCNDGDATTENDVTDGTCGCAGTPINTGGTCTTTSNIAIGGTATESSVQFNATGQRAIDGNTDGDFWNGNSVSLTNWETQPWIEIDLGQVGNIESFNVSNRTDCCSGFLENYHILISDVPFTSSNLAATQAQVGVVDIFESAAAGTPSTIAAPANTTGRYVRIQLEGTSFLGLAELEIIGCFGGGGCPAAGTTCDDGDANTTNDLEDGNCNCAGTPISCPTAGTACDDGDATTENDVEDGDCGCAGTPCPTVGTTCDDGNANTENDIADGLCGCAGTPIGGGCTVTENLALNGTATESSFQLDADGSRAIDGETNGDFYANSVTLTNWTAQPWVEVDLGAIGNIETVNVWNRTDCCNEFLKDYYILVSDVPFTSTDLTATLAQSGVDGYFEAAIVDLTTAISIDRTGRYVRIQLQGTSFLGLAELEIIGCINGGGCPAVGTACDDGDASTQNDVEDGNCGCAGTPCPTVGATCDDGDANTTNDIEDGNCNCAGTPINCPTAGTACNDGDASTQNDVEDGNCGCAGTPCPTAGTTCDDGDATTENDVEDGNCNCAGTPISTGGCTTTSNLALTGTASQSSTLTAGGITGSAEKAIDGNTNGVFFTGNPTTSSVSATNNLPQQYWEVELDASYLIEEINVYNRTDGSDQTNDIYVLVSDVPFTATDLAGARAEAIWEENVSGLVGTPSTVLPNIIGKYVRVQMEGSGYLVLAEVEVIGCTDPTTLNYAVPNMLYFNAKKNGIHTNLDWLMAKDVEVDFYEVEVSTDGNSFRLLDETNAARVNSPRQYDMVDLKPAFGENFYRLKVNQLDGSYFYSNIRRVNFEIDFDEVIVFPNPTKDYINIDMRDFAGKTGTIEIYNNLGQKMMERTYLSFPSIPAVFDVSDFTNGMFTISIKVDNYRRFTKKFIVSKL